MTFKREKFLGDKLVPRESTVNVPALADWFDGPPEWKVRGLTGHELGKANEAAAKNQNIGAILESLASTLGNEKVKGVKAAMGLDDTTPQRVATHLELVAMGSLDPVCDYELAVRLCRTFPIEFTSIALKILELTGAGHEVGKPGAFGSTPESKAL